MTATVDINVKEKTDNRITEKFNEDCLLCRSVFVLAPPATFLSS